MSVVRIDLDKCVGCKRCVDVCPMDVLYFDSKARKSIIAYPENCQNCGQCYVFCPTRSIGISNETFGYAMTAYRCNTTTPKNQFLITQPGVLHEITKGKLTT